MRMIRIACHSMNKLFVLPIRMFSKILLVIFSILPTSTYGHDKPKERSELEWSNDFKEFCDGLRNSGHEKEQQSAFENCVFENNVSQNVIIVKDQMVTLIFTGMFK